MQMPRILLVLWMTAVLISGAHGPLPPGYAPPMPGLFQPRWPLGPVEHERIWQLHEECQRKLEPPRRRWHRPALAHAAATLRP
jgi:hypothetical protein